MNNVSGKRVYLSGPMTNHTAYNVAEFAAANVRLREMGAAEVFDPAFEWYKWLNCGYETKTHEQCMLLTLHELTRICYDKPYYDMVVQLGGWAGSEGAWMEYEVARSCGIPCVEAKDLFGGEDA